MQLRTAQHTTGLKIFGTASILLVALKLALVAHNEIIAVPDDSAGFVRHSLGALGELGPPIGYPLWLWLVREAAVPQRLAIELLYCSASIYLATVLAQMTGLQVAIAAAAVLILNPGTFYFFDRALSDPLFLCLTLFSVALSLSILHRALDAGKERPAAALRPALALGVVLGCMAITRNEAPLSLGWLLWLGALHWYAGRLVGTRGAAARSTIRLVATMVLAYAVVSLGPKIYFQATKGVWADSIGTLPSHMGLLQRLASIDDGEPPLKFVAVSSKARKLAYQVSPTLRTLAPTIERADNMYQRASLDVGKLPPGEIGSGWIWHVFNDAAISTMTGDRTPAHLSAFWDQANKELDAAFASGRLASRAVLHPLLGPGILRPFATLPHGLSTAFEGSFFFSRRGIDQGFASDLFDRACTRRTWLTPQANEAVQVAGWLFADAPTSERPQVQLGHRQAGSATPVWVNLEVAPNDGVSRAFSKELGRNVQAFGFSSEVMVPRASDLQLRYTAAGIDAIDVAPVVNLVKKQPDTRNSSHVLYHALDRYTRPSKLADNDARLKAMSNVVSSPVWQHAKPLFAVVLIAPFVLALVVRSRSTPGVQPLVCGSVLLAGLVLQRLGFYALINENAWSIVDEPRYVAPVFPLLLCMMAMLVPTAWAARHPRRERGG